MSKNTNQTRLPPLPALPPPAAPETAPGTVSLPVSPRDAGHFAQGFPFAVRVGNRVCAYADSLREAEQEAVGVGGQVLCFARDPARGLVLVPWLGARDLRWPEPGKEQEGKKEKTYSDGETGDSDGETGSDGEKDSGKAALDALLASVRKAKEARLDRRRERQAAREAACETAARKEPQDSPVEAPDSKIPTPQVLTRPQETPVQPVSAQPELAPLYAKLMEALVRIPEVPNKATQPTTQHTETSQPTTQHTETSQPTSIPQSTAIPLNTLRTNRTIQKGGNPAASPLAAFRKQAVAEGLGSVAEVALAKDSRTAAWDILLGRQDGETYRVLGQRLRASGLWTQQEFDGFMLSVQQLVEQDRNSGVQAISLSRQRAQALIAQIAQSKDAERLRRTAVLKAENRRQKPAKNPSEQNEKTEPFPQSAPVLPQQEKQPETEPVLPVETPVFVKPAALEDSVFPGKFALDTEKPLAPSSVLVHDAGVFRVRPEQTEQKPEIPAVFPLVSLPVTQSVSLPERGSDFLSKEMDALYIVDRLKGGQYRQEEFEEQGLGPYDRRNRYIVSLAQRGWLKINKAGAISTTALGRKMAPKRKK